MVVVQANGKATTNAELPANDPAIVQLLNENDILKRRCSYYSTKLACSQCEFKTNCNYRKSADRMSNNSI